MFFISFHLGRGSASVLQAGGDGATAYRTGVNQRLYPHL